MDRCQVVVVDDGGVALGPWRTRVAHTKATAAMRMLDDALEGDPPHRFSLLDARRKLEEVRQLLEPATRECGR